jgi:hypothetical protein
VLPRRQLWKVEIDDGRPAALARRFENQLGACEVTGERLLEKDWLAEFQGALSDRGLEVGRYRDGDDCNLALLDQCLPGPEPMRDFRSPSELRRPRRVGSCQRDYLAAGIVTECRDQDGSPVIASDDANTDHDRYLRTLAFRCFGNGLFVT